jgi:hypothetical protein
MRPNISARLATRPANEAILDIGQANVIWPSIGVDRCRMAAPIVCAIDQDTAHARGAHLSEGDLLLSGEGGHAAFNLADGAQASSQVDETYQGPIARREGTDAGSLHKSLTFA